MAAETTGFTLDPKVRENWITLLKARPDEAADLYFAEILPAILESYSRSPEICSLRQPRCKTLVSLMGYSPETVVITAAVFCPQTLVVIRSDGDAFDAHFNRVAGYLDKHGIVTPAHLKNEVVNPTSPKDIYTTIRRHLGETSVGRSLVDVTGGKKVMSATAAQAAWELGVPLCYVESTAYNPALRRPEPGTERVIVLENPSEARANLLREDARRYYGNGQYLLARKGFEASSGFHVDNRLEELAGALCACYQAWMDVNKVQLARDVEEAERSALSPRIKDLVGGRLSLDRHLAALRRVAKNDRLALLATFLELSSIYQRQGRHDFSSLLAYRVMEAITAHGLRRIGGGRFDVDAPEYSLLGDPNELAHRYCALCEEQYGRHESGLPEPKVGLAAGYMLLCLCDEVNKRLDPELPLADNLRKVFGIASLRNSSVLAHGARTLQAEDSAKIHHLASRLAKAVLGPEFDELDELRQDLRPLDLGCLA